MKKNFLIPIVVSILLVAGCRPYQEDKYTEVQPNETAFLIPLEGASKKNQGKFDSEEFLNEHKIATKRIYIPRKWHQTGRLPADGDFIDTVRVITVDRSPVTREWTSKPTTGTSSKDDSIPVETQESIGLNIAVSITVSILEKDAAKFLYNYSGKKLATIVDTNVRSLVAAKLADKFGVLTLDDARMSKGDVFENIRTELREELSITGINLQTFGNVGGLEYQNPEIQQSIDEQFKSQQKIIVAENERKSQEIVNQTEISIAETERRKAEEFASAMRAASERRNLEISMVQAEKWDGKLPNIVVIANVGDGSNLPKIMGIPLTGSGSENSVDSQVTEQPSVIEVVSEVVTEQVSPQALE